MRLKSEIEKRKKSEEFYKALFENKIFSVVILDRNTILSVLTMYMRRHAPDTSWISLVITILNSTIQRDSSILRGNLCSPFFMKYLIV